MIAIFNYDNYLENPVAKFCVSQLPNPTIFTLDDLMPDIQKLHHARESFKNVYERKNGFSQPSFIGDQIRLYYSLLYDNYLYCDADVYLSPEVQKTIWENKNCVYYGEDVREINNGTFFCSDRGCEFNQYYFDLYENKDLKDLTNVNVYFRYPYKLDYEKKKAGDMNLLNVPVKHFLLSRIMTFYKQYYLKSDLDNKIYFTKRPWHTVTKFNTPHPLVWQIGKEANVVHYLWRAAVPDVKVFQWNTTFELLDEKFQEELWKEQMRYTLQKSDLQFIEI